MSVPFAGVLHPMLDFLDALFGVRSTPPISPSTKGMEMDSSAARYFLLVLLASAQLRVTGACCDRQA